MKVLRDFIKKIIIVLTVVITMSFGGASIKASQHQKITNDQQAIKLVLSTKHLRKNTRNIYLANRISKSQYQVEIRNQYHGNTNLVGLYRINVNTHRITTFNFE